MQPVKRLALCSVLAAVGLIGTAAAQIGDGFTLFGYNVTPLVSDLPGAPHQDGNLKNAWGVAFSPGASPFWVSANGTGLSSLYQGDGTPINTPGLFPVTIPCPPTAGQGSACPAHASPTGIVWNPSAAFLVPGTSAQAAFIFATEDGTIAAWARGLSPGNQAVVAVDNAVRPNAANGAVYKGLAVGTNGNGVFLFATNFRAGTVDVFGPPPSGSQTGMYVPAKTDGPFSDPQVPAGFAPFGIHNINGDLFVTYAKQDGPKHDDVAGLGNGFVDVFDTDGHLLRRFAARGLLNSPWGVTRASYAFGRFSGDMLIGNFGDGKINAFTSGGAPLGQLPGSNGFPLSIDGLWALTPGGGAKSSPDTLYFTAGPHDESDGVFGTITPISAEH